MKHREDLKMPVWAKILLAVGSAALAFFTFMVVAF